MVRIPEGVLDRFEAFTCFNSPYRAHDEGRAIDLYPGCDRAVSPVSGEVVSVERVRAPPKPYAPEHDFLVLVDTGAGEGPRFETPSGPALARLLHLDPDVVVGDRVGVGDDLGRLLRAGFFAPWVDRHLHLGFRPPGVDTRRAAGSLPVTLDLELRGLDWDGTGRVRRLGETYVELGPPNELSRVPAAAWVCLETDDGTLLDGGLPHYPGGGRLDALLAKGSPVGDAPVCFLETRVGVGRGRRVSWEPVVVSANGVAVTGLSLFGARADRFRPKLVCPGHSFEMGDPVRVRIERDHRDRSGVTES